MAGLIESYKKVYENKAVNIWVFVFVAVWSVFSNLTDIAFGHPDTFKQNFVDIIFNLFFGLYSLHFFNNAIKYNYSLPFVRELNLKNLGGMVLLNIVWAFYMILGLVLIFLAYVVTHSFIAAGVVGAALLVFGFLVYYIFLAFADDFKVKGLFNITLIFKFMNKTFYKNLGLFLLVNLGVLIVYLAVYVLAAFAGVDKFCHIAGDYYLFDMIMYALIGYFLVISWVFAFPYSLIDSYKEKSRPIVKGDNYGENA